MPQVSRGRALAYLAAVLLVLAVGGRFLAARDAAAPGAGADTSRVLDASAEPAARPSILVHVVGAVRSPGLYELEEGSRTDDAIRRAGGAAPEAAIDQLNLAAPVADGQQVVVPSRGGSDASPESSGAPAASAGPLHLNTATLEELDSLPGVGPVTAQRILDYRTAHGAFQSVDELDAVPGIGPARLEQLKELVAL